MHAMEAGAVDVILKPRVDAEQFLMESKVHICDVVKAAARMRPRRLPNPGRGEAGGGGAPPKKLTADVMLAPPVVGHDLAPATETIVCIGASTGGTESLRVVLEGLPANSPPILVVQHMPERFTAAFAHRLNGFCEVEVKEAADGDAVLRGHVLIAPGDRHMLLQRSGAHYYVSVKEGPLVSRHRPSVDVLFRSAARFAGANAMGIIMTGMGDDGARGMLEMKQAGAHTMAQDEASCVVFGMPAEAIKHGGVDRVLPLDRIASEVVARGR
jgi:two-component system chemotaxis response regulator CheB